MSTSFFPKSQVDAPDLLIFRHLQNILLVYRISFLLKEQDISKTHNTNELIFFIAYLF